MDATTLTTHRSWTVGVPSVEQDEMDLSCLVCGQFGHNVDVMVISPDQRFRVCAGCVDLCNEIVEVG